MNGRQAREMRDFGMGDFDPVPLFLYELCIKEKDFAAFMVTCFQAYLSNVVWTK